MGRRVNRRANPSRTPGCGQPAPRARLSTIVKPSQQPTVSLGRCEDACECHVSQAPPTRTAQVELPANYDPSRAYPLLIGFIGQSDSLMDEANGEAIFLFPAPFDGTWCSEIMRDDYAWLLDMVDQLSSELCINRRNVFAYGFSWGGIVSAALGCAHPSLVSGVSSTAGDEPPGPCKALLPTQIMVGAHDGWRPGSLRLQDRIVALNGCGTTTVDYPTPNNADDYCQAYQGCAAPTLFCEYNGWHSFAPPIPDAAWGFLRSLLIE